MRNGSLHILGTLILVALLAGCGSQAGSGSLDQSLSEGWKAYAMGDFDTASNRFSRVTGDAAATQDQLYSALLGQAAAAQYRPSPDLDQALDCYQRLGRVQTKSAVPQSMLGIGMVYVSQGKVQDGQAELTDLTKEFPDSDEAGEATVQLANSLWRPTPDGKAPGGYRLADKAQVQRGMDLLEKRLQAYPKSPLAAVMHMMLASQLIEQEAYKEAVAHLEAALEAGVQSSTTRGSITWQIARIAEDKLHDYALAEKYYADYADKYDRTQLYYLAQLGRDRMKAMLAKKTEE